VQAGDAAAAPAHMQNTSAADRTALADPNLARTIHRAAQKYGLDPKLVSAVAEVESGGNQKAVSPAGAVGVMQLMPETAAGLGVDPYNLEGNIEGGAKYLREMLDAFGGDVKKAVAAYNAGPNAVKAYGGVPPYAETQNYVDSVLDIYR
jgi:putative murein lytic transglycosylase yjbJ